MHFAYLGSFECFIKRLAQYKGSLILIPVGKVKTKNSSAFL